MDSNPVEGLPSFTRRGFITGSTLAVVAAGIGVTLGPATAAFASANGQVPASQLTSVPGSSSPAPLEKSTAAAWLNLVAACRTATGVSMVVTSPYGGYRDLAAQQYIFDHPQGPVAISKPGGSSHGWGTAVDIWNHQDSWLAAHSSAYGFVQSFGSEPWHFQYTGSVSPAPTYSDNLIEEGEMYYSNLDDFGTQTNGVAPLRAGYSYLQGPNGVLRPVGSIESTSRGQVGQTPNPIHGWNLGALASSFGVMEVTWNGLEPTPTGRILYGSNCASARPAW